MAQEVRRVNSRSYKRQLRYTEEDGNAVRVPEWEPKPEPRRKRSGEPKRGTPRRKSTGKPAGKRKRRRSRRTRISSRRLQQNRAREMRIGAGYVAFLTAASIITVALCINFLHLRAKVTTQSRTIAAMETDLSELTQDNDAYYNEVLASVTIDDVKDAALNRLGMHYPSEDEIRYYDPDDSSYVRQYRDVS